ncbi:trypsin-like peptidase domain-containing protein [Streptomyces sp. NPDC051207]|uniref:trypsin-like peptidase domain-containing protein n=1 Tax=Streptomyces sp. NPDC051207 TaxID=3154641 RepID=UPI00343AB614
MNEGKPALGPSGQPETPGDVPGEPEARRAETAGRGAGPGTDGDYELERPAAVDAVDASEGAAVSEAPGASAGVGGNPTGLDAAVADAGPSSPASPTSPVSPAGPAGPSTERPGPLHDPDPYSTPPYGEPGPWAPAPPVQHPATTPARGTALAAPPGAPVPPVQHPAPAPAPGTGVPPSQVAPGVAAPGPHPAPMPGHETAPAASAPLPGVFADAPAPDPWRRYDPWAVSSGAGAVQQSGAAVPSGAQRRRRGRRALLGGMLLVALVSGGIGGAVGAHLERNGGVGGVELPQAGKEAPGRAPDSVAGIAARALPSVVTLHVSGSEEQGTGTGFVLDGRGHILTNNHVVEPAGSGGEITVTFHSGDTARAKIVGRDSGYDLAVVRVSGVRGLTPMPLGNSDNVQVGDPVVAIGAPFDLAGTVTSGIISAKQRPITAGGEKGDGSDVSYVDALQTDAPINPGNSGGPLLDTRGRVIGINSAIRSADSGADLDGGQSGSIGLGFAIPINQGKRVAEELIATGKAAHPVIGITLDMNYGGDGARVGAKGNDGGPPVTPGGPGAKAGIKAGDVITEVDGQRVHSGEELIVKTRAHRPGDRLELTLKRDGEERTVSLVLGSSRDG